MNAPTIDRVPRYAPSHVIIAHAMKLLPVLRYIAHPAGTHPANCPIKSEMVALELVTAKGSRWYGCERAYINSELRMVCIGFDSRDEVRRKWDVCEVAL